MKPATTTMTTTNGLDLAAIHPSKGPQYSPNLYAWLTLPTKKYRVESSRVFVDKEKTFYIGLLDHDGASIGSRLLPVLGYGAKEASWSFGRIPGLTEVTDFWARYMAVGRCAIDRDHTMYFVGDDTRWSTDGDRRDCLWCGNHAQKLHRSVEVVERAQWKPVRPRAARSRAAKP